ncbi:fimbrial protein [Escherichia coli]|nr:fimbrial protein [Escherichia coli]
MKYTFLVGTGIFLLSGWLMGNLAVAGQSKKVSLSLRILVDADELRMQLKGATTVINGETVMATEIPGLGIRIENGADNSLFRVGEGNWTPFNFYQSPNLKAVPVKQSGAQLMPAVFNATMTMVVDYQ